MTPILGSQGLWNARAVSGLETGRFQRVLDHNGLSKEQIHFIQQFAADFDTFEHFLRVALDSEDRYGGQGVLPAIDRNDVRKPVVNRPLVGNLSIPKI
jgi:hypothetical protein